MNWLSAPRRLRLARAAGRSLRPGALAVVMLTVAACGHLAPTQTGQGATSSLAPVKSGNIVCVSPSRPSPQGGCVTTDAATGISVRVTGAYADVTGTIVELVASNTYNYPLSVSGQLALASGYVLRGTVGGHWGGPDALIVDEPLPPQDFAPRVEIIATTSYSLPVYNGLNPPTMPPAPPWLSHLNRISVRVPFMISPPRDSGFTYHMAPTIKRGIGVQVQSLDISPSHKAFFGAAGGARIELRFTGLPADMELLAFIRVLSQRTIEGGGTAGDRGPGLLELRIPGMTVNTPVMTLLQSPAWPDNPEIRSVDPTVGPAGTVQFEAAFQGSGVPTGQPATLTISDIQLLTGGIDGNAGDPPVLPTYQITLPLR
jgi:hypothetical protein